MITTYYRTLKDSKLQTVDDIRRGVWVHVVKPTQEELAHLSEELKLDNGLLQDATDFFEVPRFEAEDGVAYFYTRYVTRTADDEMGTAPILIAVGGSFVVTITPSEAPFVTKLLESETKVVTTQKTKLFLQLMFAINTRYTEALTNIRREVRRSRRSISDIRNRDIIRFASLEDTLTDFTSALVPTNTALRSMLSGNHLELFEEDVDLVQDIRLSNEQLIETARAIEHTIINVRSTYTTITTNNLNQIIKMFTALTIILTVPTVIGSFFGMNVPVPFQASPIGFWLVILCAALISALIAWVFFKRDWI